MAGKISFPCRSVYMLVLPEVLQMVCDVVDTFCIGWRFYGSRSHASYVD